MTLIALLRHDVYRGDSELNFWVTVYEHLVIVLFDLVYLASKDSVVPDFHSLAILLQNLTQLQQQVELAIIHLRYHGVRLHEQSLASV